MLDSLFFFRPFLNLFFGAIFLFSLEFFAFCQFFFGNFSLENTFLSSCVLLKPSLKKEEKNEKLFCLNALSVSPSFAFLQEELECVWVYPRPDTKRKKLKLAMILKEGKTQKILEEGKKVSFQIQPEKNRLSFSEKETDFSLECLSYDRKQAVFRVFWEKNSSQSVTLLIKAFVEKKGKSLSFKTLSSLQWIGKDFLHSFLYQEEMPRERLVIGKKIYSLKEGDFLFWNQGFWKTFDPKKERKKEPIARIQLCGGKLEVQGWNEPGEEVSHFFLSPSQEDPFKPLQKKLFSQLKLRSQHCVSVLLEKRHFSLKEGDWLIREKNKWNFLHPEEIDSKLLLSSSQQDQEKTGPSQTLFFCFETIEKQNSSFFLKGHLFPLSGTQDQVVYEEILPYVGKKLLPKTQEIIPPRCETERVQENSLPPPPSLEESLEGGPEL